MNRIQRWYQEEKKKLNGMSKKEKAAYLWSYYKLWFLSILCILSLLVFTVVRMITVPSKVTFFLIMTNTHADVGDNSEFWKGYTDYTGYDPKEGQIHFDAQNYFDFAKNQGEGNQYYSYFCGMVDADTLDAVVMEKDNLTAVGETGRLKDLNREACAELKEKYGDRLIYATPLNTDYSTEPVPIGIDISDSILVTKYGMYPNGCALGIGAGSTRIEAVIQFLNYIMEDS
jgi:hypothetical protein